ncbi:hypothetical protein AAHB37_11250 [Glutamicibacter halophytocola]|uniref:hypothetical protein n=1 Tax=Glutamicibacter halophytocola TaxID=1933880 RepID=UPI00321AEB05
MVVVTDSDQGDSDAEDKQGEQNNDDSSPRKAKRSSVPSWDDIMFGKRKKDTDS